MLHRSMTRCRVMRRSCPNMKIIGTCRKVHVWRTASIINIKSEHGYGPGSATLQIQAAVHTQAYTDYASGLRLITANRPTTELTGNVNYERENLMSEGSLRSSELTKSSCSLHCFRRLHYCFQIAHAQLADTCAYCTYIRTYIRLYVRIKVCANVIHDRE